MTLGTSDPAPSITAPNQRGDAVSPSFDIPTVLYFYPRDNTSGCTTEATQFTLEQDTYDEAGVTVYGVSTDDVDSHREFAEEHDIEIELLANPDGTIADAFGVNRRPNGATERTTFILADGEIKDVYTGVNPDGHPREVLLDMLEAELVALDE